MGKIQEYVEQIVEHVITNSNMRNTPGLSARINSALTSYGEWLTKEIREENEKLKEERNRYRESAADHDLIDKGLAAIKDHEAKLDKRRAELEARESDMARIHAELKVKHLEEMNAILLKAAFPEDKPIKRVCPDCKGEW